MASSLSTSLSQPNMTSTTSSMALADGDAASAYAAAAAAANSNLTPTTFALSVHGKERSVPRSLFVRLSELPRGRFSSATVTDHEDGVDLRFVQGFFGIPPASSSCDRRRRRRQAPPLSPPIDAGPVPQVPFASTGEEEGPSLPMDRPDDARPSHVEAATAASSCSSSSSSEPLEGPHSPTVAGAVHGGGRNAAARATVAGAIHGGGGPNAATTDAPFLVQYIETDDDDGGSGFDCPDRYLDVEVPLNDTYVSHRNNSSVLEDGRVGTRLGSLERNELLLDNMALVTEALALIRGREGDLVRDDRDGSMGFSSDEESSSCSENGCVW